MGFGKSSLFYLSPIHFFQQLQATVWLKRFFEIHVVLVIVVWLRGVTLPSCHSNEAEKEVFLHGVLFNQKPPASWWCTEPNTFFFRLPNWGCSPREWEKIIWSTLYFLGFNVSFQDKSLSFFLTCNFNQEAGFRRKGTISTWPIVFWRHNRNVSSSILGFVKSWWCFFTFCHGKSSPLFTTILENMFGTCSKHQISNSKDAIYMDVSKPWKFWSFQSHGIH